jgi:paired amphipathic helix protein Sin3a
MILARVSDSKRRLMSVQDSYQIFTIDKLIGVLIKQVTINIFTARPSIVFTLNRNHKVQTVFGDAKSQDLLEILKRERALACPTTQDQINNRRNAEKVLGPDENLFRVDWVCLKFGLGLGP